MEEVDPVQVRPELLEAPDDIVRRLLVKPQHRADGRAWLAEPGDTPRQRRDGAADERGLAVLLARGKQGETAAPGEVREDGDGGRWLRSAPFRQQGCSGGRDYGGGHWVADALPLQPLRDLPL